MTIRLLTDATPPPRCPSRKLPSPGPLQMVVLHPRSLRHSVMQPLEAVLYFIHIRPKVVIKKANAIDWHNQITFSTLIYCSLVGCWKTGKLRFVKNIFVTVFWSFGNISWSNACLFELMLNVPVNSYGHDGTLPPLYGILTQNQES